MTQIIRKLQRKSNAKNKIKIIRDEFLNKKKILPGLKKRGLKSKKRSTLKAVANQNLFVIEPQNLNGIRGTSGKEHLPAGEKKWRRIKMAKLN